MPLSGAVRRVYNKMRLRFADLSLLFTYHALHLLKDTLKMSASPRLKYMLQSVHANMEWKDDVEDRN